LPRNGSAALIRRIPFKSSSQVVLINKREEEPVVIPGNGDDEVAESSWTATWLLSLEVVGDGLGQHPLCQGLQLRHQ